MERLLEKPHARDRCSRLLRRSHGDIPIAVLISRVEAFPVEEAPQYLVRDNDGIYGDVFRRRIGGLGIEDVRIASRSPWKNPYVERLIDTIRRECLDHVIVLGEAHLRRILAAYFRYYHEARPHQGLDGNAPAPREIEPPECGPVVAEPMVGGLHHRYFRRAA